MKQEKQSTGATGKKWVKRMIVGTIFFFLLLVGVGLLMSPMLESTIIENAVYDFSSFSFTREQLAQNRRNAGHFEVELDIAIPELPEVLQNLPHVDRSDVIGFISIDRVNLFLPIFHGATNVNLLAGAGTMHYNQQMGEGNYPLAGHHMNDPSLLFGPILNVRVGDLVQITDRSDLYSYRVVDTKLVHQSEVDILNDTEVPTVTLFTCDTSTIATDFLWVVIAEIIDTSTLEGTGLTTGGLQLSAESRGNPYLVTFQMMNERVLTAPRQDGARIWAMKVTGISLVVAVVGMVLFVRIEKRYLYLKQGTKD